MGFADNLLQTEPRRVVSMNSSDSSKERSGRQPMESHRASPPKRRGVWAIREYPPGCGRLAPPIVRPNEEAICASTKKLVPRKYPPRKSVFAVRDFPPSCGRNALRISKEMNEVLSFDGSKNIGQEMSDAEPLKEMVMTVGKEITGSDLDGDVPRSKGGEVQQEPKGSSTKGEINQDEFGDGSENALKVVQEGRPERSVEFLVGNAQDQKFDAVPKSAIGASEKDPGKKIAACIENGSHKRKVPDVSGCENESLEVEIAPGRIVNGLMAKKNCPWRQVKANNKLDNLAGSMCEKKWKRDDFILAITGSDLDGDAYRSTLQRDVPRSKGGEVQQEPKGSSTKGEINQDEFGDGSENAVKVVQEGRPERSVEFLVGNAQDQKFDAVPKSAIGASEKDPGKKIAACIENGSHKRKVPDVSGCENESLEVEIAPGRIVNGLMAKKNCPWREVKANNKLDNLAGSMSEKKWKRDDFILVPRSDSQQEKNEEENHGVSHIKKNSFRTQGAYLGVDHIVESDTEDHLDQGEEHDDFRLVKRQHNVDVSLPPSCPSSSGGKVVENDATVSRKKVRETMRLFQSVYRKILQKEEAKVKEPGRKRIDFLAAKDLKERGKYINVGKQIIGSVPGVEVGDEFQYRVELTVIGLHRQTQGGIDYIKQGSKILATSIVSSGGYDDDTDNSDVLIYTGSGGNMMNADKEPEDQKLERGNLALKNSADTKNPVRVIRGDTKVSDSSDAKARTYVYDGLYLVERYWQETGSRGKLVFKFMLVRMQGQPELAWKVVKKSKKSKVREGLCMDDISEGKEKMPICAVNTIDDERPPTFTYVTNMIYSDQCRPGPPKGCSCTKECSEAAAKCLCIKKNGGEIPYNHNGALVEVKDLVYECGPSCGCPPSCYNRVSQFGIKFQLEIFKTESRGWGVRSLSSIPSGSFICEYVGELLDEKEANLRTGNDEYLFDIGDKDSDAIIPGDSSSCSETVGDVSFTIDAKQYGNVGRFVNHSCSPNLYAQDVLFDHDDKRIPHVMLFARENIPPLQELTYHYNYKIDTVYDSDGSIKKKNCYCGSQECSGRMY